MAQINYRTLNIDALDPESSQNFDIASLAPGVVPQSTADVQASVNQIRQLLRGGDSEGALVGALGTAPYGADAVGKDAHAAAVFEILQSIRQSDMSPLLTRLYGSEGGIELLDVLMKYLYKGMAQHPAGSAQNASSPISNSTPRNSMSPQSTGMRGASLGSVMQAPGGGSGGEAGGQAMSVLLSWHEKLVEIAGPGSIVRVMTDRRTV